MSSIKTRFLNWRLDRLYRKINRRLVKCTNKAEAQGLAYATLSISERQMHNTRLIYYRLMSLWLNLGYVLTRQEHYDHLGYCHMALFLRHKI